MLRCGILPLIRSSSCQPSRFYRDRKTYAGDRAGFRRQMNELGDADLFEEDPEGSYEADFSKVPEVIRENQMEMKRQKEKVKLKMIERKYFRVSNQPSFLTWAEKEQIRHLNQLDPKEWNAERLSESFPATEDVIIKILKAKWTPVDMKRVRVHDENIKKNWQAYKANKFEDLDPELKEHLAKFSQRKFNSSRNAYALSKNDQIEFKFPKPKHQEFAHIVSSCKPLQKSKEIAENKSEQIEAGEQGSSVMINKTSTEAYKVELPRKLRVQNIRFDELQKKLGIVKANADEDDFHIGFSQESNSKKWPNEQINLNRAVWLKDFEEIDLNHSPNPKELSEIESVSDENESDAKIVHMSRKQEMHVNKYVKKDVNAKSFTASVDLEPFIDKIVIPKEVRKEGGMYRVNDCFFDDNGEFLFKVPGLEGTWH